MSPAYSRNIVVAARRLFGMTLGVADMSHRMMRDDMFAFHARAFLLMERLNVLAATLLRTIAAFGQGVVAALLREHAAAMAIRQRQACLLRG